MKNKKMIVYGVILFLVIAVVIFIPKSNEFIAKMEIILTGIIAFVIGYALSKEFNNVDGINKRISELESEVDIKRKTIASFEEQLSQVKVDKTLDIEITKAEYKQYLEALSRIETTLINLNHSSKIKTCSTIADIILEDETSVPCEGFILTSIVKEIIEREKIE